MELSNIINSFGLILDIVGVIILFRFGLPPKVFRDGVIPKVASLSIQEKSKEYSKFKRHKYWSYFGLSLLIIGFALQIASNFLT